MEINGDIIAQEGSSEEYANVSNQLIENSVSEPAQRSSEDGSVLPPITAPLRETSQAVESVLRSDVCRRINPAMANYLPVRRLESTLYSLG